MQSPIRIVLAAPDRLHRQALHCLLDLNRSLSVAAVISSQADVTRTVEDSQPDVLVMDDRIGGCGVIPRLRDLLSRGFVKTVCLTSSRNMDYVRHLMSMGASACVSRSANASCLYTAILRVSRGETYVSPPPGCSLLRRSQQKPANSAGEQTIGPVN